MDNFELPSETINKSKKRKKRNAFVILALILAVFLLILAGVLLAVKYLPNFKQASPSDYYDDLNNLIYTAFGNDRIQNPDTAVIDGVVYLSSEFIKQNIDNHIFWEKGANTLTITTNDKVIRTRAAQTDLYINHEPFTLNLPVTVINEMAYLPEGLLESIYPIDINSYGGLSVTIDMTNAPRRLGIITAKETAMRYEPTIKGAIAVKLKTGDEIYVYNEASGGFFNVRSNGIIGYIYHKDFEDAGIIEGIPVEAKEYPPPFEGGVIMAWDQIRNYQENFREDKQITQTGLNVLSPTWFSFDNDKLDGSIINTADISYVNFAHDNNMQVWALLTDNFNSDVAKAVLTDPDIREYVIKQLLGFCALYNLDGLNIDFEAINEGVAPYYIQFLRELAPLMREEGLCLSVCMFVPTYTAHYNRTEVVIAADYICVMAYDEHYGPASGAGPVASLPFVKDGIIKTLNEVPPDKLILGLPFYTRVWKQTDNGVSVDANMAMGYAEPIFKENGARFEWMPDIGSYYGEYRIDDTIYKTWLEDERSIEEKLKLYEEYNLAGVAGWSRNLETDGVWRLIDRYVNQ